MAKFVSFTVAYRTGGRLNCTWRRTLAFATREEARQAAADTERMGYKALVFETAKLDAIGLPVGWCSGCDPMTGDCRCEHAAA